MKNLVFNVQKNQKKVIILPNGNLNIRENMRLWMKYCWCNSCGKYEQNCECSEEEQDLDYCWTWERVNKMFGNPKGELRICSLCKREHDIKRGTRCWCACGHEIRSKEYVETWEGVMNDKKICMWIWIWKS